MAQLSSLGLLYHSDHGTQKELLAPAGGLRTAHVSLLWEGLERSLQEALSNLWLGQGLFRAPKWASKLQLIVQGVTQHGAEEMGAVWQTRAERGAWGRWEAFRLDLASEERDKSVGDILGEP